MSSTNREDTIENILESGEENLTARSAVSQIEQASDVVGVLNTLIKSDDFQDISPEDMDRLQAEIWNFVDDSLEGRFSGALEKYNVGEYDRDYEAGMDHYEFSNYISALNTGIESIVRLNAASDFFDTLDEAYDFSTGEYQAMIQGWTREKIQAIRASIGDISQIDAEYLNEIKNEEFRFPDGFLSKEFWIVLSAESGATVEEIVDLVVTLIPSIFRISRYLDLRALRNNEDPMISARADVQIAELIYHNPIFTLGEISLEQLQEFWQLLKSGTNESVVIGIVGIVGLITGGAALAKLGLRSSKAADTPDGNLPDSFPDNDIEHNVVQAAGNDDFLGEILHYDSDGVISVRNPLEPEITSYIGSLPFSDRLGLMQRIFGRNIVGEQRRFLEFVDSIDGTRREKLEFFTSERGSNLFQNTLEIGVLFDLRLISFTSE